MRIAYILTSLGIGGAERQVTGLAERMRARGHAVMMLVLTPPAADQWVPPVVPVHLNLRHSAFSAVSGWVRAARILRKFQPDILHTNNFHGNVFGRTLKLALPGMRVISTIHNVYEGGQWRMAAYRVSDPLSRCTIAVCQEAANKMLDVRAVPRRKCTVITNGIDANEFSPHPTRNEDGPGRSGFVWLTIARVVPAKNYENLLRAFAWVCQADDRARLWVAGEGKGEYAQQMRALGVELGLSGAIRWLGLRRDVAGLLDAVDGFVLSSAWEGMPLALGEAMAMEKPVVVTDVGGVRELVGDCGTIVLPGMPSALARGMLDVMRMTPEACQRLGQAARRRMLARFSSNANADGWEALYRAEIAH